MRKRRASKEVSRIRHPFAAAIFVALNVGACVAASQLLTAEAWSGLTIKHDDAHESGSSALYSVMEWTGITAALSPYPDTYEACERVRYLSFVRAPTNAFSSLFFLAAPTFHLVTDKDLGSGCLGGLRCFANLYALLTLCTGTLMAYASFGFHASASREMHVVKMFATLNFLGFNLLKFAYLVGRLALRDTLGSAGWRRVLRITGTPLLMAASVASVAITVKADEWNWKLLDHYYLLRMIGVVTLLLTSIPWAWRPTPLEDEGGLSRGFGILHLILLIMAVAAKAVDDTKMGCTDDAARDSPLQLVGAFHVLMALSTALSNVHARAQICVDIEDEDERPGWLALARSEDRQRRIRELASRMPELAKNNKLSDHVPELLRLLAEAKSR